jgi:hypothetical protein
VTASHALARGPRGRRPSLRLVHRAPVAHRRTPFDRDYWLEHCDGFRVDAPQGRLGFVEKVIEGEDGPLLKVRAGRLGHRILLVPAADAAFVVPRTERVHLHSDFEIVDAW